MEKPYLNITELSILLGQGRRQAERVMNHLLEIAKEQNYYIPESKRDVLIPTHLVKKELKIKEVILNKNRNEVKEWKGLKKINFYMQSWN
mgnify:CR=1 FL=1